MESTPKIWIDVQVATMYGTLFLLSSYDEINVEAERMGREMGRKQMRGILGVVQTK
jgi:hypothetical protein